jgi:hypothetical protein
MLSTCIKTKAIFLNTPKLMGIVFYGPYVANIIA